MSVTVEEMNRKTMCPFTKHQVKIRTNIKNAPHKPVTESAIEIATHTQRKIQLNIGNGRWEGRGNKSMQENRTQKSTDFHITSMLHSETHKTKRKVQRENKKHSKLNSILLLVRFAHAVEPRVCFAFHRVLITLTHVSLCVCDFYPTRLRFIFTSRY